MSTFDVTKYYPIIKGMEIKFVALATTDISVEVSIDEDEVQRIQAEAEANGKADYQWDCELTDATGKVVCVTTNRYQLRGHGS